jgi:hypothetical protein
MSTKQKLTKSYSGIFGHQVLLKNRRGKTVMTILPVKPKMPPSEKQVAVRERLRLAAAYGKHVKSDPALLAMYAERTKKNQSVYRLAVNDFLRPSYIRQVDVSGYHGCPGEKIIVSACDDFKVMKVTVTLKTTSGEVVETGNCVKESGGSGWIYSVTTAQIDFTGFTVVAVAYDLPGHPGEKTVTL